MSKKTMPIFFVLFLLVVSFIGAETHWYPGYGRVEGVKSFSGTIYVPSEVEKTFTVTYSFDISKAGSGNSLAVTGGGQTIYATKLGGTKQGSFILKTGIAYTVSLDGGEDEEQDSEGGWSTYFGSIGFAEFSYDVSVSTYSSSSLREISKINQSVKNNQISFSSGVFSIPANSYDELVKVSFSYDGTSGRGGAFFSISDPSNFPIVYISSFSKCTGSVWLQRGKNYSIQVYGGEDYYSGAGEDGDSSTEYGEIAVIGNYMLRYDFITQTTFVDGTDFNKKTVTQYLFDSKENIKSYRYIASPGIITTKDKAITKHYKDPIPIIFDYSSNARNTRDHNSDDPEIRVYSETLNNNETLLFSHKQRCYSGRKSEVLLLPDSFLRIETYVGEYREGFVHNHWYGFWLSYTISYRLDDVPPDPVLELVNVTTKHTGDRYFVNAYNGIVSLSWKNAKDNGTSFNGKPVLSGIGSYEISFDGKVTDHRSMTINDQSTIGSFVIPDFSISDVTEYAVEIIAIDNEDNRSAPYAFTLVVDNVAPDIDTVTPTNAVYSRNKQFYANKAVDLSWAWSFKNTTDTWKYDFELEINTGDVIQTQPFQGVSADKQSVKLSDFGVTATEDTSYTLHVTAKDGAANVGTAVSPPVYVDSTPPTLIITSESLLADAKGKLTMSWDVKEIHEYGIIGWSIINELTDTPIAEGVIDDVTVQKQGTLGLDEITWEEGVTYTLSMFAIDGAGNETPLQTINNINPGAIVLTKDESWTSRSLTRNLIIPAGITLILEENASISVNPNCSILVYGTLQFETGSTVQGVEGRGAWRGISVYDEGTLTFPETGNCHIKDAIRALALIKTTSDLHIFNTTFTNNQAAIHVFASNPIIKACTFINNGYAIKEDGESTPQVTKCVFTVNAVDYYDSEQLLIQNIQDEEN